MQKHQSAVHSAPEVVHELDNFDLDGFTHRAATFGCDRFGYVVTPNVDHLIRYHEEPGFRELYRSADFVLMDSRFAAYMLRIFRGQRLPVCTGADLTAALLKRVVTRSDRVVLIGCTPGAAATLANKFGLDNLLHLNPPMGFISNKADVERCLEFVESASPFRFCFLAVGSPQQEMIAAELHRRGRARGLALCVGASINFLTGLERRAPSWVQHLGLEWLYRMAQSPRRLGTRYILRGPRIFKHLRRARIVLRGSVATG